MKEINKKFIIENAKKIKASDFEKIANKAKDIEKRFRSNTPLHKFLNEGKIFIELIKDYFKGNYKKIPYWALSAVAFSLLYVLNPLDLLPDTIPIIGQIDDATVIGLCVYMVDQEVKKYKKWKMTNSDKEI